MNRTSEQHLDLPIRHLQLNKRAQQACHALGLTSVREALECDKRTFTGQPNCGAKTFAAFRERVERFAQCAPDVQWSDYDLDEELVRVTDSGAARTLARAGFATVGHFLTTPVEELASVRGVDEASVASIRQSLRSPKLGQSRLLPSRLLNVPIGDLLLPDDVVASIEQHRIKTLGELLDREDETISGLAPAGISAIQSELSRVIHIGGATTAPQFTALLDNLFGALGREQVELVKLRIGSGVPAKEAWQIAAETRRTEAEVLAAEKQVRLALHDGRGRVLDRFHRTIRNAIRTGGGFVAPTHTALYALFDGRAPEAGQAQVVLRLAAFLFPDEYSWHGSFVSTTSAEDFGELVGTLRRLCTRDRLPRPLEQVIAQLADTGIEVTQDMVVYVLRTELQRSIEIDPERGELVTVRASTIADRLHQLLEEHREPVRLDSLMFDYRERYRRCHRAALRDSLRSDYRFLEVAPAVWSLRDRHLDELDFALPEANRIANIICTVGGRHPLPDLAEGEAFTERQVYLLADILRHDPTVLYVGRLEFCPRHQEHSQVMQRILRDLKRAMGEIPISRFLANQTDAERPLVERLIHKNRLFVCPTPDRVDMLTNYPYDSDRLRRLLIVTDQCIEQHGGYTTLDVIAEGVEAAKLGGSFLTDHLLQDLLRRHGHYEFLPDRIVADQSLGLTGWIQQRAREAIRAARGGLSASEVIAQRPELAEFEPSLETLLRRDPLLISHDGESFRVA